MQANQQSPAVRNALVAQQAAANVGGAAAEGDGGSGGGGGGHPPAAGQGVAAGGGGDVQQAGSELQQLRAELQTLVGKCDKMGEDLGEIKEICETLQVKNAEHENLWAANAPKLVRLDEIFESPATAHLGGGAALSGTKESISSQQTTKRISSQWAKDQARRWYAIAHILPEVTEYRLSEWVGQDAVVNPVVHKMINNFAAWKITAFEPMQVDKTATIFINDRFSALVRCVEAFIEAVGEVQAITAAQGFLQEFRRMATDLNTYTSKHRGAFESKGSAGTGSIMTSRLEQALNQDLAEITKQVGGVANILKQYFPDEPPKDHEVLPAVPPPEFAKTRMAINDISGVHNIAAMIRAVGGRGGAGGSSGGSGGGPATKKQRFTSQKPPQQMKSGGATKADTVAALRESGCPRGTCRYYWADGKCSINPCQFNHDQTKAAVRNTGGGGGAATKRVTFGTGGGFNTQQQGGRSAGGGGSSSGGGGFAGGAGGGGSGGGGFQPG